MPDRATIAYDALVLCEDIRLEFDGKRTLVGVYTSRAIAVPFVPFRAEMSLYASGMVAKAGDFRASFKVEDQDGNIIFQDESKDTVILKTGRFVQTFIIPIEIRDASLIKISLFDQDTKLATLVHPVAVQPPEVIPGSAP